ncbi:peptidoglycan/LPS O-acetylase OafA/YrhL [Nocardia transvalensis]|uniref:Peptidoglycan/LPS O-acetylase OafA/YrhL n=1 Tax=Nocardia transvalensis TaxID=37333 RepID=A0A7W9P9C4_9NOCA|nr:peptidoglycan/LPS O-acetylase OafA/YrhL [Nocardia transvalensis]
MTTLWIVLGIWVVCSIPIALVLGRLFRRPRPRPRRSPESHRFDDELARGRPRGRL